MLNLNYNLCAWSQVPDVSDFYKSGLPEVKRVRAIVDSVKILFGLPANRIVLEVAEGKNYYRIAALTNDIHKVPFGWFVYLPGYDRLDLYSLESPGMPIIQWKNKKVVYKNYYSVLAKAGVEKIFDRVVNVT